MGLPVSVALRTAVLEGHGDHAGLYGGIDISWPDSGFGGWNGPIGSAEPREFAVAAVVALANLCEFLVVPGAMAAGRICRGVSLHAAAGANRLGLLRAAGAARRANSGHGRRGADIVVLYRRVLRGDISRWHRFDRARAMGCGARFGPTPLDHDAAGDPAAGGAPNDPSVRQSVDHAIEKHVAGVDDRGAGLAVQRPTDHRRHLPAVGGLHRCRGHLLRDAVSQHDARAVVREAITDRSVTIAAAGASERVRPAAAIAAATAIATGIPTAAVATAAAVVGPGRILRRLLIPGAVIDVILVGWHRRRCAVPGALIGYGRCSPGTARHSPAKSTAHVLPTGKHVGQQITRHHAARDPRRGGQRRTQKAGPGTLEHTWLIARRVLRRRGRVTLRWRSILRLGGLLPTPRSGIGRRRRLLRTAAAEQPAEKSALLLRRGLCGLPSLMQRGLQFRDVALRLDQPL